MKILVFVCGFAAALLVSAGVLKVAGCVSSFYRTVFIVVLLATFSASGESEVFKLSEQSPISTCEARYLKSKWRTRQVEASQGMSLKELQKEVPLWVKEWKRQHSWPMVKAKLFAKLCECSALDVSELDWYPAFADWTFAPMTYSHKRTRYAGHPVWTEISARREEVLQSTDPAYKKLLRRGGGGRWVSYHDFDHSAPDWEAILPLGFPGLANRLNANWKDTDYYRARKVAFDGVAVLMRRFVEAGEKRLAALPEKMAPARRQRLLKQTESMRRLAEGAPRTAYDVLNFIYIFWCMSEQFDGIQVRSLGNLDRLLSPYYESDIAAGRTTEAEFREQLAHFWWQWGSIDNYFGQPLYFGGTRADGTSGYGEVSRIMLDIHDSLALPTPKLHLKMGASTPDWVWRKSLDMVRRQRSISFIGEEPHWRVIRAMGYTEEQARTFLLWGCYEWAVKDSANDIFGAAVNLVKPIEEMLADAQSGKFAADGFQEFKTEYLRRASQLVDEARCCVLIGERCRSEVNPSLLFSIATEYSVKSGKDALIDGTENGNHTGMWMVGLGTAVDALVAVDEIVYRRADMDLGSLGKLMSEDWRGREDLRLRMLRSKCKWGNNDARANAVAGEIVKKIFVPLDGMENGRGGRFKACGHVATWFIGMGGSTAATPDGRKKGEELSKNISPTMGADTEGATALVESVAALDARGLSGDFPLDVAFLPGTVAGEKGLDLMRTLIKRYFDNGGLVIQFNVADPQTLRDAQAHPERYENLQVRICGWNVRWNDLPKREQDAYIRRAENLMK